MLYQQTCILVSYLLIMWVTQMTLIEQCLKMISTYLFKLILLSIKYGWLDLNFHYLIHYACIIFACIILYLQVASQMCPIWSVSLGIPCCSGSYILSYARLFEEAREHHVSIEMGLLCTQLAFDQTYSWALISVECASSI